MAGQQAFNPDSSGYDIETAKELMELYPLTVPKPNRSGRFDRETISQDDAFQAWVWHGEENDWVRHGGTLDPRTGMYLKGMAKNAPKDSEAYKSMRLGIEEEERRGNKVIFKDGRYYSVPSLTEQPTSKSIDDIIQKSNAVDAIAQSISTRTQPSDKSISDISIPISERYGDPAKIKYSRTVQEGIPMDTQALGKALREVLTSEDIQKSGKSQKEISEQSIGEMLGYREGFNKKIHGEKLINKMLNKIYRGNAPGGLVAYRTQEGYPTGGGIQVQGFFKDAKSKDDPDTLVAFGDESYPNYRTSPRTLLHELIHAGLKEKEDIIEKQPWFLKEHSLKEGRLWSTSGHKEPFKKAGKDILKYNWILDLLNKSMARKEGEEYQLPEGFIE